MAMKATAKTAAKAKPMYWPVLLLLEDGDVDGPYLLEEGALGFA